MFFSSTFHRSTKDIYNIYFQIIGILGAIIGSTGGKGGHGHGHGHHSGKREKIIIIKSNLKLSFRFDSKYYQK